MPKITRRVVDAAEPKGKSYYIIWDSSLTGFGLQVLPSGGKSYIYQYRTPEGRTRRQTIGKSTAYTADEARKKAGDSRDLIRQGLDPLGEKQAQRDALLVGELLDRYTQSAKFAEKAELTRKYDEGRIKRHLKPLLGKKVANKLTADQIRKASKDIEEGRTAKKVKTGPRGLARVKGGPGAARMAIRLLKSAYSWAEDEGLISNNAAKGIKVGQDERRNITLTADEYKAMFQAIDELESHHQIRSPVADAIRVIALTGSRRGEIAGLKWRHVDLKKGVAEIPRSEHKTGKKTEEARTIGLPAAAQAIISRQPEGEPDSYVFQPAHGEGRISLSKPWEKVRKEAGLKTGTGLHALRHSIATLMAVKGAQASHIMSVLGHRNITTSQKYIHIAQDIRQRLAEDAASGISAALEGKESAEVVRIKEGK